MRVLAFKTGLFPDSETVAAALAALDDDVTIMDLTETKSDETWDGVVAELISADRVITL